MLSGTMPQLLWPHVLTEIAAYLVSPSNVNDTQSHKGNGVAAGAGNLQRVERQMFMLLWGPTIAAVSVILDHAEDTMVVRQALDSTLLCARIASCHRLDEVKCRPLHLALHALQRSCNRWESKASARVQLLFCHNFATSHAAACADSL